MEQENSNHDDIIIKLLRETVMRNRMAFPENEEDEKWFNEGVKMPQSGDFMERLFDATNLGSNK